jgi:glycerol-3-phosphate dehydrogenase
MNRNDLISDLQRNSEKVWDIVIIGGGATGLGIALDSVTRGYKTLLLEKGDFAVGTSSRSTKLVHGGVRYLAQGDLLLVVEALRERGLLLKNAPHVTNNQEFVIPLYRLWDVILYYVGLKFYDILAGRLSLGKSHFIRPRLVRLRLPLIKTQGLKGGIVYHDGQFDDARLALGLASTAIGRGATVLNYFTASGFIKDSRGVITGVRAKDNITGRNYLINTGLVVNATGVFADTIHTIDDPFSKPTIRPSQGVHIVLDRTFLQGDSALMIPKTSDGRVLFAIPWCNRVVVGTTDTPVEKVLEEPVALEQEIEFILATAGRYLTRAPRREDILSIFAGLRPLAAREGGPGSTKEVSRRHKIIVAPSRLLTIIGGKWTTYRCMAEETIDRAIREGMLPKSKCMTRHLAIDATPAPPYVPDEAALTKIVSDEMVCRVDDVLSRRTRMLITDARRSVEMAPLVAALIACELGYDKAWEESAVEDYSRLAEKYE